MTKNRLSTQRGFSMLELVIVLAVMLVLSAITLPSVVRSMSIYRLSVATTSLQNIIETARFNAVRLNTKVSLRQINLGGQTAFYVDLTGTGYVGTDPVFLVPNYVQISPAGAPAASTTGLANTAALGAGCITFTSRGVVDYSTCGGGVQSVWFISLGSVSANTGYRAITVTPMGQAKTWSGSTGGNWGLM
ncbi:MAG TPA: prepilin-type N-terminal cleavage/methylation domain-containing protein [Candidatus Sulfotelmatobacter sp.]|nr:prepilin-type N-terminal cleavage/methylation domain-containing protein [Candidatus Sulfotelmatobacter sp.]